NEQSDRRNLARQSKSCHVRLPPAVQASFVKVLKRPAVTSCPGGRPLEDVFQIMWLRLSPQTAGAFLERLSCPRSKRYSPLVWVLSAHPMYAHNCRLVRKR